MKIYHILSYINILLMRNTKKYYCAHTNIISTKQVERRHSDIFTDRSKAVLLLWIIYVISVFLCYAFMHVCLLMPCGHLLAKG